jgi:hypothetical protein
MGRIHLTMEQALATVPDVKIFVIMRAGQREHLEEFAKGRLRFRRLTYYSGQESQGKTHHDRDEQVAGVFQAEHGRLDFKVPGGPSHTVSAETGLVGQVMFRTQQPRMICCLHAIHGGEWTNREFSPDLLPEYREYLYPPARMSEYGDHVWVILKGDEFRRRLLDAAKRDRLSVRAELVRYVDFETVQGKVPRDLIAFVKGVRFADEREFRLEVRSSADLPDPFVWGIGDLSDVSVVMPLKDFRRNVQIYHPAEETRLRSRG